MQAALKCKHCGSMLDGKPVVIEQTAKKFKAWMVVGRALVIVGIILIGVALVVGPDVQVLLNWGLCALVVGGIVHTAARYQAWWHHG